MGVEADCGEPGRERAQVPATIAVHDGPGPDQRAVHERSTAGTPGAVKSVRKSTSLQWSWPGQWWCRVLADEQL